MGNAVKGSEGQSYSIKDQEKYLLGASKNVRVIKIKRKSDKRWLAMKMEMRDFVTLPEKDKQYFKNERNNAEKINHPFVIKLIDKINF